MLFMCSNMFVIIVSFVFPRRLLLRHPPELLHEVEASLAAAAALHVEIHLLCYVNFNQIIVYDITSCYHIIVYYIVSYYIIL